MKLTEREKAYHDGYEQGRFDEYAERMGYDQAEKVKAKIDKQKNCPYCHVNDAIPIGLRLGKPLEDYTYSDSPDDFYVGTDGHHAFLVEDQYEQGYFNVSRLYYCPMCGRSLNRRIEQ